MHEEERQRLEKLTAFEDEARAKGFKVIAGIDEAGRGPLAGPVVAAACVVAKHVWMEGVDDSKKLSPKQRAALFTSITTHPDIFYGVGIVDVDVIDQINIFQATIQAMLLAVKNLPIAPDYLLVDGLRLPHPTLPVQKIIKGDTLSQSIAAASIIAKETRDRLMEDYHLQWPHYGFGKHKGYGTPQHLDALNREGPCPIHRRSFAPVRETELKLN